MQVQKINWIKASQTVLSLKFPKGITYQEQIQIHYDGTIKLESYVSVLIGSFNDLLKGALQSDRGDFCHRITEAMKIKRVV